MKPDPLKSYRAAVAFHEEALARARAQLSAAADNHGIPHNGLFGETMFVSRAAAERWEKEAKKEGYAKGREQGHADLIPVIRSAVLPSTPWSHLSMAHRGGSETPKLTGLAKSIIGADRKRRGKI